VRGEKLIPSRPFAVLCDLCGKNELVNRKEREVDAKVGKKDRAETRVMGIDL
jgi:hypothetical protein